MSEKVKSHHRERKAVLYIRQSSAYQVAHNQESGKLQYAMHQRLERLGWKAIEVIDDDLGCSAAGTTTRSELSLLSESKNQLLFLPMNFSKRRLIWSSTLALKTCKSVLF